MPVFGRGFDALEHEGRGVVDEDVEAAKADLGRGRQRRGIRWPGDVGVDEDGLAAGGDDAVAHLGAASIVDVADDDRGAMFGEQLGRGGADAVGGAGDEGDFVREAHGDHVALTITKARRHEAREELLDDHATIPPGKRSSTSGS